MVASADRTDPHYRKFKSEMGWCVWLLCQAVAVSDRTLDRIDAGQLADSIMYIAAKVEARRETSGSRATGGGDDDPTREISTTEESPDTEATARPDGGPDSGSGDAVAPVVASREATAPSLLEARAMERLTAKAVTVESLPDPVAWKGAIAQEMIDLAEEDLAANPALGQRPVMLTLRIHAALMTAEALGLTEPDQINYLVVAALANYLPEDAPVEEDGVLDAYAEVAGTA